MDMRLDQERAVLLPSLIPRILQELVLSHSWASTDGRHKGGKGSILTLEVFLVALSVSTIQWCHLALWYVPSVETLRPDQSRSPNLATSSWVTLGQWLSISKQLIFSPHFKISVSFIRWFPWPRDTVSMMFLDSNKNTAMWTI